MPEKCPDLSKHNSFFADAMRANPGLYDQLKDKKTKLGVTLGHCIKTGVDNKGETLRSHRNQKKFKLFGKFKISKK